MLGVDRVTYISHNLLELIDNFFTLDICHHSNLEEKEHAYKHDKFFFLLTREMCILSNIEIDLCCVGLKAAEN